MRSLRFHVDGPPLGKARHRTRVVQPKDGGKPFATQYALRRSRCEEDRLAAACIVAASEQGWQKANGPVVLVVLSTFALAASLSPAQKRRRLWHIIKPDASNVLKTVEDALNSVAWLDDSQLVLSISAKVWTDGEPGYDIAVFEFEKDGGCAEYERMALESLLSRAALELFRRPAGAAVDTQIAIAGFDYVR